VWVVGCGEEVGRAMHGSVGTCRRVRIGFFSRPKKQTFLSSGSILEYQCHCIKAKSKPTTNMGFGTNMMRAFVVVTVDTNSSFVFIGTWLCPLLGQ